MTILILREDTDTTEVNLSVGEKLLAQFQNHLLDLPLGIGKSCALYSLYNTYQQSVILC